MKRKVITCISIIILLIILILSNIYLRKNNNNSKGDTFKIVTSFYPIYLSTKNVTQNVDDVEVVNLTQTAGGCLHDYQLLPQDMIELETADVLIVNGQGMEEFLDKVISSYPNLKIIYANDENIEVLIHNHEGEEEINSHVWLSVSNNIEQVENIQKELSKIDEKNSDKYKENASNYISKLNDLRSQMDNELSKLRDVRVVTSNETFDYLFKELGVDISFNIEEEIGTSPNTGDIARVIQEIKNTNSALIILDAQEDESFSQIISQETGLKTYTLDAIVTGDGNKDHYINTMKKNIEILKECL